MNNQKRNQLKEALNFLGSALAIVEDVWRDEQGCFDNFPENLEGSERYCAIERAVDMLEDAIDAIRNAQDEVEGAIDCG